MIAVRTSDVHEFSTLVIKSSNARFCCSDVATIRLSPVSSSPHEYVIASLAGSAGSGLTSFVAAALVVFFAGACAFDAAFLFFVTGTAAADTSAVHVALCFFVVAGLVAAFDVGPGEFIPAIP